MVVNQRGVLAAPRGNDMTKLPSDPASLSVARDVQRWRCPICDAAASGTVTTYTKTAGNVVRVTFRCNHRPLVRRIRITPL